MPLGERRRTLAMLGVLGAIAVAAPAAGEPAAPGDESRTAERLASDPCVVAKDEDAGGGVTGARKLTLRFGDSDEVVVKWKPVPRGLDAWNNSPRKEIAAYQVQRLFLDPADHVVPTTVLRCLETSAFAPGGGAKPNVAGADCVLGEITLWVHDAHVPERLYDPKRFERDRVHAAHLADLNLLTHLIRHQDGRSSNFLLSNDPGNRRVYSIDNGIAFGAVIHNYFVRNWDEIRVPALRRASVDRLRGLPDDAFEGLAVVAELRRDADGVLRPVAPGPSRSPDDGVFEGEAAVQLGLRRSEIADLAERRKALLERVDAGRLRTF